MKFGTAGMITSAKVPAAIGMAPDWSHLDARLAGRVARGYFDGIGLMVGQGDRIVHEAYFGVARPATVLHVASVGKWVAAATIAAVVDTGRLRWDDEVRRFLPQFDGVMGSATVRQLLSHTAGFPAYQPEGAMRDSYLTLAESVRQISGLPPDAPPGRVFKYGGLAMQVAGRMAELADERAFNAIFMERIAAPLGMTRSGFAPVSQEDGFSPMLGGSLYTSAGDYSRFLMMFSGNGLFRGHRVLSQAAIGEMQADQVSGAAVRPGEYVEQARANRRKDIYGLGLWREEVDRLGAPTLISSPGWAGAYAWCDKACDAWGIVLAKANVGVAVADGYNTFLGSSIYAPMVRSTIEETQPTRVRRALAGPLYYEESGQGEPVIFIHGHGMDRRQWAPQVARFDQRYRVIRYDLRGYGRSDMPAEDRHFLHADDLRDLMDALGLPVAHLIGLSLGGVVVTDFLARYPDRVRTATMAGADLRDAPGPDEPWTASALARRREEITALKKQGVTAYKQRWFAGLVDAAGSARESLRQPLWRMIDEWQAWQALHAEPRCLLGRGARSLLAAGRPTVPVLVIRGERDTPSTLPAILNHAASVTIPDCGPVSNLEQPALFSDALQRFLDRSSSS